MGSGDVQAPRERRGDLQEGTIVAASTSAPHRSASETQSRSNPEREGIALAASVASGINTRQLDR